MVARFEGLIDEVRVYGRALSVEEIGRDRDTRVGTPIGGVEPEPAMALSLEDGAGGVANDSSTYGNPGYLYGTAKWTTEGRFGKGIRIEGEGQVVVNDSDSLDAATFTASAWVKPRVATPYQSLFQRDQALGEVAWQTYTTNNTTGSAPFGHVDPTPTSVGGEVWMSAPSSAVLPLGQWSHIAYVVDGTNQRLYVNGAQVVSAAAPAAPIATGPLRIGGSQWDGEAFQGIVDEVRFYDEPLTGAKIAADRDTPIPRAKDRPGDGDGEGEPPADGGLQVPVTPPTPQPAPAAVGAAPPAAATTTAASTRPAAKQAAKKKAAKRKAAKRCVVRKKGKKRVTVCAKAKRSTKKAAAKTRR